MVSEISGLRIKKVVPEFRNDRTFSMQWEWKKMRIISVSLLSDFTKDLIYVPCGISQDWIVRLPSLNALHNKKEDSKVPNVYLSEPSI